MKGRSPEGLSNKQAAHASNPKAQRKRRNGEAYMQRARKRLGLER